MKKFILALVAVVSIGVGGAFGANYLMTQGSGTTFGSAVVGGVNYTQGLTCDPTTPTQCAAVSAVGSVKTEGAGASGAALAGSPFRVGLSDGTNSQNWLAAIALGDGVNGNNTGAAASWLWNGATYDRARSGTALGSTLVGGAVTVSANSTANSNTNPVYVDATSGGQLLAQLAQPTPAGTNTIGTTGQLPYPVGAVPLTASATGTTGATTATLGGAVGKTTYICSLSVRANATATTNVTDTVTGVITGTLSRILWVPANTAGLGVDEQIYNPCVPASGTNTAIAVVSGAPGTGGVVSVNATGYQL